MFHVISANSAVRITEARSFLDFLSGQTPLPPIDTPRFINSGKGLIYVQLYGAIEYTVYGTVAETITYVNNDGPTLSELKPILLGLALDSSFESLFGATKKKWHKRYDLLRLVEVDDPVSIPGALMPTDGRNIRVGQLTSIWQTFCITDPIFHDVAFQGRLDDIVENRNLIAHGNEPPHQVGSRVSIDDLYDRIQDVSTFCSHFLNVFEDYVTNRTYRV